MSGGLTVTGNFTVNGTTTTINTSNLQVEDKNIVLNYSSGDSSSTANGAGITIQDAVSSSTDATILWDATDDEFDFSHPITVASRGDVVYENSGTKSSGDFNNFTTGGNYVIGNHANISNSPPNSYAHGLLRVTQISGTSIVSQEYIPHASGEGIFIRFYWSPHGWTSWRESVTFSSDGSGSGLDADLLDGHDSGSFLRSNVTDNYTSGTLSFNSGTALKMLSGSAFNTSDGDVYASMRVIRNAGTSNLDGMYIGYANSGGNSAPTRLFGAGATSNGLYVYSNYSNIYGSARSPIFYDMDDTSYYVSPATGSKFLNVGIARDPRTDSYRLSMGGHIHMNANQINFVDQVHFNDDLRFYDEGNNNYLTFKYGNTGSGGIRIRNGNNAVQGFVYADNANIGFLSSDGSWSLQTNNSVVYAYHQFRAPSFYDMDDTGYYVNPNNGGFVLKGGTSNRVTFTTNDSGFKVSNPEGTGANDLRLGAAWGRVGIYNNNVLSVMSDSTSGIHFVIDNTTYGELNTDYLSHTSDIRAPLFYDSNNTGFYLDPANSSFFNQLSASKLQVDSNLVLDLTNNSTARGPWNPIASSIRSSGYPVYNDEDFQQGSNGVGVYNNSGGNAVTITRVTASSESLGGVPNSSGYVMKIAYLSSNTNGSSPGFGGFHHNIPSEENHTFVQVFQAASVWSISRYCGKPTGFKQHLVLADQQCWYWQMGVVCPRIALRHWWHI